jgi:nitrate reductase cytochrome c-type subunit
VSNHLTCVAIDYINALESQNQQAKVAHDSQRMKVAELEAQMLEMTRQMQALQQQNSYPTPPNSMPQNVLGYQHNYNNRADGGNDPARTLPPIMSNNSMQGVQYEDRR